MRKSLTQKVTKMVDKAVNRFEFDAFETLFAYREYRRETNQFSIHYSADTKTKANKASRLPSFQHDETSVCKSGTTIKIGKVSIVAILDLVERVLKMNYNLMHDLTCVDLEYREHISHS